MIVSPSVLSLDYSDTKAQIAELNASGAQWLHFDVMDGHFVPNLTFGPDILKAYCRSSELFKDVHLMVSDPSYFADVFMDAGADLITFHIEAVSDRDAVTALRDKIRNRGRKAGLSISPDTPIESIRPYISEFDLILIMSVVPGYGGQKFIPASVERIQKVKSWIRETGSQVLLEVDGGINEQTALLCKEAGTDVIVAGSYVFKNNIQEAVKSLCGQ